MSNTVATKSSNPFQSHGWNYMNYLAESSFSSLPQYYENDLASEQSSPTFRSVSPKSYNRQKNDYYEEIKEELEFGDDCDSLYEATLMNSNFLNNDKGATPSNNSSLARLRQILVHLNPSPYNNQTNSPLATTLSATTTTSVRSQFSASSFKSSQKQDFPQQSAPLSKAFLIPHPQQNKEFTELPLQ